MGDLVMACLWCRHGKRVFPYGHPESRDKKWHELAVDCVINPEWNRVTGSHYCSKFSATNPSITVDFRYRMDGSTQDFFKARTRYKKAEARLKVLNARLRALK